MERLCYVFELAPGQEQEYLRRHADVWPDVIEAIKAAGFSNYSLFKRGREVYATLGGVTLRDEAAFPGPSFHPGLPSLDDLKRQLREILMRAFAGSASTSAATRSDE